MIPPKLPFVPSPTRRRFVQGITAGGLLLGTPWAGAALSAGRNATELRGPDISLTVAETQVNYTGRTRPAVAINGSIPAPTLRLREGDEVTLRVTNHLREPTSIHWHGILLPWQMDGVPGISFPGIAPGETFTYRFRLQQSGTYWYHSHSGLQEQTGLYGALIIEPRDGGHIHTDREHVIVLSDWLDDAPMAVWSHLKMRSDVYNFNQPTLKRLLADAGSVGWQEAIAMREMFNRMRMSPTDLSDLSSVVTTCLMNGLPPAANWRGEFKPGERVRLRCINAAGNTIYDVRIPGLALTVIQADGQDVDPVTVDEFRIGPGQTYDVLVQPRNDAYTLFAQTIERTAFARGTLSVRDNLEAPVPVLDAAPWLTMTDMMGAMYGGSHAGHTPNDAHSPAAPMSMPAHQHGGMAMPDMHSSDPLATPSQAVHHARTEYGPTVDMRVDTPRVNLDDPGIGLRGNGRRVLTLADLHTVGGPQDPSPPGRELELHLTGNMERYSWSFDGLEFGQSTPVALRHGERVRVILQNDTMMTHPMHLHGMWSDLEDANGAFMARLHTIPVQPAQRISFLVTADALGRWAWHCHLMFHMHSGMFREVVVA